jgi:GxxExxY protein
MNYADYLSTYSTDLDHITVAEDEAGLYSTFKYPYQEEAYKIIGACMEVHSALGKGFVESIYHEALCLELTKRGIPFESNKILRVYYKDQLLKKTFTADILAYEKIIVELKAVEGSLDSHQGQVLNYLNATRYGLGLLFNFGTRTLQYRRIILSKYIHHNK